MDTGSLTMIIVVAVVILAAIAFAVMASRNKKKQRDRERAAELREQAAAQASGVQQHETGAREAQAAAEQARAEAERRKAEADRLEAEASERARAAQRVRDEATAALQRFDDAIERGQRLLNAGDPDGASAAVRAAREIDPGSAAVAALQEQIVNQYRGLARQRPEPARSSPAPAAPTRPEERTGPAPPAARPGPAPGLR